MQAKPAYPAINKEHPLARGLVGAWVPAERGGTVTRDLVRGASGSLTGGVSFVSTKFGRAYQFGNFADRTDRIEYRDSPYVTQTSGLKPMSVSALVRYDSTLGGAGAFVAVGTNSYTSNLANYGWFLFYSGTSWQFQRANNGINPTTTADAGGVSTDVWRHVVGTFDGSVARIYQDGVFKQSTVSANNPSLSNAFMIGGYCANQVYQLDFAGQIAGVSLWNRALTPKEIADLYSDPWALYRPSSTISVAPPEELAPATPAAGTRTASYSYSIRTPGKVKPP